jgi:Acetyltransferase (isoleucine patch superfamily)
MLNILISKIISKIRRNEFNLDSQISSLDLIILIFLKLVMYLRGLIKKRGMKGSKKNIFIGKKTQIIHKSHIYCGNGVQIKDYVEINGLCKDGIFIGDNSSIGKYSIIRGSGALNNLGKGIKIGKNFGCADYCFFGCSGGITIGDNVIMGQNVRFHSQNHKYNDVNTPIKEQGVVSKGIKVGDDCWIGAGAVILDGVKIGSGCIIGANSLVNKDISDYSVAVGNPVKVVKKRN